MNASIGYGNYNALFITLKTQDWHDVTCSRTSPGPRRWAPEPKFRQPARPLRRIRSTSGRAMAISSSTAGSSITCSLFGSLTYYKSQSGFMGHLLGGWTIAPVFTAGSGLPLTLGTDQRWRPGLRRRRLQSTSLVTESRRTPFRSAQPTRGGFASLQCRLEWDWHQRLSGSNMFANPAAAYQQYSAAHPRLRHP